MKGQPAKTLRKADVGRLFSAVRRQRYPARNATIILLSFKAGLRACEIARLKWSMVTDARGQVGTVLELPAVAAKKGSGRRIPLHPDLRRVLLQLQRRDHGDGPVIGSERGGPMTAASIVNWFGRLYSSRGFKGCSSHSGRRTFVTNAARSVHRAGGSLRDVQELAGHRSLSTTQAYIDGDADAQRRLVGLV